MPLEFASMDMAPSLKGIWLDAFPQDSAGDVDFFFARMLRPDRCAVWLEDGRPVSMTFLLPAELITADGGRYSLRYVYAASTLTEYRGRGLFGSLLTGVRELLRDRGVDALFLRPALPGLFTYYSRFGFKPYFYNVTENIAAEERNGSRRESPGNAGMHEKAAEGRNSLLKGYPAWVKWPDELVSYAAIQAEKYGGAVISADGGWCLCEPADGGLFAREWLCREDARERLITAVADRFPASSITLRRPARPGEALEEAFGMVCPLTEDAADRIDGYRNAFPYMGLAFD